ncbi:MAG: protein-L-isoaspartate O-methyltransferase [Geminicoccaceae bacterium]|nr:protein-L-isoaspartate O-methyltransferase [Geminicoccaceae bacterium]MCS7267670.1 protein-L-isoaspartate O-methyltransferase [Geminicoccaceae bacterium]MCX7628708.1 protein-L-isoaspartate O-methyltransferase [Geminicoccaceae bacterium]MDW8123513.1 protein-L-isoaspartate O-methyltransferase [Geminicoccaceae bacterium]MDW8339854.1 protein-L-isoaspartate O-methyltransferase [Geminicoccaceae bacterium]
MEDHAEARRRMVENQLKPNRITDRRVLAAMGAVPRELFVPPALRGAAYVDEDLPLGDGRFLVEPLAFAKLLQAARIGPQDVVLLVGDETGYAAAVVARLAATVIVLVASGELAAELDGRLGELGAANAVVQTGDPREGLPSQAPFDVVLLVGSVREVPRPLLEQLGEGGRLVAVVSDGRPGEVTVFTRIGDSWGRVAVDDAQIPELVALRPPPRFTF